MIHSILPLQIACLAIFLHNLSARPLWSTTWSGALHLIFHTFLQPISLLSSGRWKLQWTTAGKYVILYITPRHDMVKCYKPAGNSRRLGRLERISECFKCLSMTAHSEYLAVSLEFCLAWICSMETATQNDILATPLICTPIHTMLTAKSTYSTDTTTEFVSLHSRRTPYAAVSEKHQKYDDDSKRRRRTTWSQTVQVSQFYLGNESVPKIT